MSEQSEALRLADELTTARVYGIEWRCREESAAELRRQHARIEADEALMRQAIEALKFGHPNPAVQDEKQHAITALRPRLETK